MGSIQPWSIPNPSPKPYAESLPRNLTLRLTTPNPYLKPNAETLPQPLP